MFCGGYGAIDVSLPIFEVTVPLPLLSGALLWSMYPLVLWSEELLPGEAESGELLGSACELSGEDDVSGDEELSGVLSDELSLADEESI